MWEIIWGIIQLIGYLIYYIGVGLYYVGVGLFEAAVFLYELVECLIYDAKEIYKFKKRLGAPTLVDEINALTPMTIDAGKDYRISISQGWVNFELANIEGSNPISYKCKYELYYLNLKFKCSFYYEGLLINFKRKYYLLPYSDYKLEYGYDRIALDENLKKQVFFDGNALKVLKKLLNKEYRFEEETKSRKEVVDTRASRRKYKKDGTLDNRFTKQNKEGWELRTHVTHSKFLLVKNGVNICVKAGPLSVDIQFKDEDLKNIYNMFEAIWKKQDKAIVPFDQFVVDSSNSCHPLLNDDEVAKITELLSKDIDEWAKTLNVSREGAINHINRSANEIKEGILNRHRISR